MLSRVNGGQMGQRVQLREDVRSGRSVSEIGKRTDCHKIVCDVVPSGRRASIHSVLWLLWGVYWVYLVYVGWLWSHSKLLFYTVLCNYCLLEARLLLFLFG